jgi:hypothetical protein
VAASAAYSRTSEDGESASRRGAATRGDRHHPGRCMNSPWCFQQKAKSVARCSFIILMRDAPGRDTLPKFIHRIGKCGRILWIFWERGPLRALIDAHLEDPAEGEPAPPGHALTHADKSPRYCRKDFHIHITICISADFPFGGAAPSTQFSLFQNPQRRTYITLLEFFPCPFKLFVIRRCPITRAL